MGIHKYYNVTCLSALILLAGNPGQAQVGEVVMGAALQKVMADLQEAINKFRAAGNDLELGAAVTIENSVIRAQVAYESSLKLTMDKVGELERQAVADLQLASETLIKKGASEANKVMGKAVIFANVLPGHNKTPLVQAYNPRYVTPSDGTVSVTLTGNFPFAFTTEHGPVMVLGQETVQPSTISTMAISFNVPVRLLGAVPKNGPSSCTATVRVPWDASRWYHLFTTPVKVAEFKVELSLLPASPGVVKITHQVPGTRHEEAARYSEVFHFDSHADDIEENRALTLTGDEQAAGWRIVPGTARFELVQHIEGSEGHDWYNKGYQGGSDLSVVWRVRTEHKRWGSSGKIKWRIACRMARNVAITTMVTEDVPLTWGMSRVFTYPAGTWTATWMKFDGRTFDFNGNMLDGIFLSSSMSGNSLWIQTF